MDKKSEEIVLIVKKTLLEVLFETNPYEYNNERTFFPFIEEDVKYEIKNLRLSKKEEEYYINKIVDLFGEYSEDVPTQNEKGFYYDDFYFN